jgi:hypothetical protein
MKGDREMKVLGLSHLYWLMCWGYYVWASREIHYNNPDVVKVHLRRLHYEALLGIGRTRDRRLQASHWNCRCAPPGPLEMRSDVGADVGGAS